MLSFKDFISVDYTPGMPDLISYRAVKRRRGVVGEEVQTESSKQLSIAQRRKLAVRFKRLAPRMKIARKKALRRTATPEVIKKRTEKQVRNMFIKKLTRGKDKSELSPSRRQSIEKRLDKFKPRMMRMVKQKLKDTRKLDRDRKK